MGKTVVLNNESLPVMYKAVAALLREGKSNAITSTDIARLTGIKDKRQVFEIIEHLVLKHGFIIGLSRSGTYKGYYLISNKKELVETLRTYNEQIMSMLERYKQLRANYTEHQKNEDEGN